MRKKPYVAGFDSASGMMRAIGNFLHGKDFPMIGIMPAPLEPIMRRATGLVNLLPSPLRPPVYITGTVSETVSPKKFRKINPEVLASWAVSHYPRRRYPAVMIGSSNGAAVHLCAAMGIPWLPQTFLLPAQRFGVDPHDPRAEFEWGKEGAKPLLDGNPDLVLHQMLDPVQDLLTSQGLSYFRVKMRTLPPSYQRFLEDCLDPDGTIYVLDCRLKWPTTRVSDRHIFQFGAPGGASIREFFEGSPRVAEYLQRTGWNRPKWDPPAPDGERPEAEWGFEPKLYDDLEHFLLRHPRPVRRIVFDQPERLSPPVADLYRQWHAERGLLANRLVVESFIMIEPMWTLRVGGVPFWMVFATEPMDQVLEDYLDHRAPFDEIGMMLFSHGVRSPGLVPIERWRGILNRARKRGTFIGVDENVFPQDFASLVRYHHDFGTVFRARYPMPGPMDCGRFERFMEQNQDRYQIQWKRDLRDPEQPLRLPADELSGAAV